MKKSIKSFLIAAVFALALGALAGCTVPASSGKTVVTIVYKKELQNFKNLVETTYPDIEFQYEYNAVPNIIDYRLKEGEGPDLIVTSLSTDEKSAQYALPLGGYSFSALYQNTAIRPGSIGDSFYYLPMPGQFWGYVVNRTMFEEAGLKLPSTNGEMTEALTSLKEKQMGVSEDGFVFNFENFDNVMIGNFLVSCMVPGFLGNADGVKWLDGFEKKETTFEGVWESVFDFPNQMIEKELLNKEYFTGNINNPLLISPMAKGEIAMIYGGSAFLELVKEENAKLAEEGTTEESEYVMLPFLSDQADGKNNWTVAAPDSYIGMNRMLALQGNEKKLDAAERVMALLSTREGQNALLSDSGMAISYLKNDSRAMSYIPDGLQETIENEYVYNIRFPGRMVDVLGKRGAEVLSGKADVAAALRSVDEYYRVGSDETDYDMSVVGFVEEDLIETGYSVRKGETALGNLVADSVQSYSGAPFAVVNGGGIRASLYRGYVYGGDLRYVCPYDNRIVVVDLTGKVVWEMLENGLSTIKDNIVGGRFLQVSEKIRYTFDAANPVGKRLKGVSMDGEPIDFNKTYRVAINDYMAGIKGYIGGNGDGFTMLNLYCSTAPKAEGVTLVLATGGTYRDALQHYFSTFKGAPVNKTVENRIIKTENAI